ncbi:MAG: Elongation factor 4 [Alphaproteobacteria bacterium MarineAlpha6_Bin4]|nr:MAG: Elongation factor 4 [Alphaproteobacteria bacterium MarineAlpha6_Bin4]|tara:strand:- start:15607 stop:17409 length:1803 start_codon:yes stop_codon:yes gene_type:complete
MKISNIRNFAIIAHIDHGKSTLADRLIQYCGGISQREFREQLLDSMDIERERGITIKAQTVQLNYKYKNEDYKLNLIDTPGHVDFAYEVNRSLAACEGSILVVDSTQGVEAQTLANSYQAISNDHEIIPVLNKIDLPASDPDNTIKQIEDIIGIEAKGAIKISAKTGEGVENLLNLLVKSLPAPKGIDINPLQVFVIDSWYDKYLGVITLVRVKNGILKVGQKIQMMSNKLTYDVERVGVFTPKLKYVDKLTSGEIGFITAGIKKVADCKIGDTLTEERKPCDKALPGFKPSQPVVFCGLFPYDSSQFNDFKDSLEKLSLNDSSFSYEQESSAALGQGFRCGFLGLLHMEVIRERLEREFNLKLITTAPSVVYQITDNNKNLKKIQNPVEFPDPSLINKMEEPWIVSTIIVPQKFLGSVFELCESRRGEQIEHNFIGKTVVIKYKLPLAETIIDFYDRLKSITTGYASFDYQIDKYKESKLIKLNILVNEEIVEPLSIIIHATHAEQRGREICKKLKEALPRQQYKLPIQAAIGGKIIARETVPAYRKDVTGSLYGGDRTRKDKLLKKQKKGKQRLKQFGKVDIPQSAFLEALKTGENNK